MLLGKVIGTVVASRKEERLVGSKLLVVRNLDLDGAEAGGYAVAIDAVGAGVGEVVLYATGSSARQTAVTHERPCDAVVMAIVDEWEVGGRAVWSKSGEARSARPAPARPGRTLADKTADKTADKARPAAGSGAKTAPASGASRKRGRP